MKTRFIATWVLLIVVLAASWLALSVRLKLSYDKVRKDLAMAYAVTPMDDQMRSFLVEVRSNWTCRADETAGPNSQVVKLAGMTPSVQNLIYVFNYQMPEYGWFSPKRNRQAARIGLLKAKFFPTSVDKQWHISEDQHLALLWCLTNAVYVYQDGPDGMRETLYSAKRKSVEPSH